MQLNIGCKIKIIKIKKKTIFYVMLSMLRYSLTFFFCCFKCYVRGYENNPKARQSITVIFIHLLILADYSLRF